jgi:hypothetical protein
MNTVWAFVTAVLAIVLYKVFNRNYNISSSHLRIRNICGPPSPSLFVGHMKQIFAVSRIVHVV